MLRKWRLTLAGLATAAAMSVSAQAAPLGLPDAQRNLADQGSLVERTHGWHRYCDWGPVRYHRHVPGYGNVPCYRGGYYRPHWRYRFGDDDDRGYWGGGYYRWRHHDRGDWGHRDRPRCMIEPWLCKQHGSNHDDNRRDWRQRGDYQTQWRQRSDHGDNRGGNYQRDWRPRSDHGDNRGDRR